MKILCVTPSYYPAFKFGGPIYSVHYLNKALSKKGIDINVYTTNVGLENVFLNKEIIIDGVKVNYFEFTKFFEFFNPSGWQFSLPLKNALKNNIKKFDLIYIVSTWNFPVFISSYFSEKYKKPYIISPRGHLYFDVLKKKFWKKLPYYYIFLKRYLNRAFIHYTTYDEALNCHSFLKLKSKYFVVPNGIELNEFQKIKKLENKDKKIILFLGRINWKKGLDILISAYAKILKERNDLHLLIVGNDEDGYIERVKRWIKNYGIIKDVTFTGILTGEEKLKVYSKSDIFVLPSYSENFGMSVIEAMACGIPVIISEKVGLSNEIRKNKAGLVVETNEESLYKGIKTLLDNENLRKECVENANKLVENYDINKVAEKMIEIYEKIVKYKKI
jgi:glycosyltransferase involved in cell wall biosynthesis